MNGAGIGNRTDRAFTLVELLVVVAIIALLVSILVPVVRAVMDNAVNVRTADRIAALNAACVAYRQQYNCYPGQEVASGLLTGHTPAGAYTGSQVLAARLFAYPDSSINGTPTPSPVYCELKTSDDPYDSDLFNPQAVGNASVNRPNSLSDRNPKPQAILYFPSRPGKTGLRQYEFNDNAVYATGKTVTNFKEFIRNRTFAANQSTVSDDDPPFLDKGFLLIAPGQDRQYFTGDDLKNW